jgi:hypothetical protein
LIAAAEEAHKPMPSIANAINDNGAKVLLASNDPTKAVISIIRTTLGLHSS